MVNFEKNMQRENKNFTMLIRVFKRIGIGVPLFMLFFTMIGHAEEIEGIEFPDGEASFADVVERFIPGCVW